MLAGNPSSQELWQITSFRGRMVAVWLYPGRPRTIVVPFVGRFADPFENPYGRVDCSFLIM